MLSSMTAPPARRAYRSPRRAEQAARTRADIVAAAARLFAGEGWASTTMSKVAAEAGVAVETVYQRFRTKAALLQAAVDATIGDPDGGPDGDPAPLRDQDRFTRLSEGDTAQRLAAAVRLVTDVNARTHALFDAWRQAAGTDPAIAAALRDYEARRRSDVAAGLALLHGGPVDDRTVDAAWALFGTDVYGKLVGDRAWSQADYGAFARQMLTALLPAEET